MDLREAAATRDGLPRRAFAYAPTPDPATWRLPFLTAKGEPDPDSLPQSTTALSEGGIPDDALAMVRSKLRQAYRRWKGGDVTYPGALQEDTYGVTPGAQGLLGCVCNHPYECGCTDCSCRQHVDPSVTDVTTGLSILMQMYQLKAGEIGQPSQMALIDTAIVAFTSWVNLEGSEIGMAGITEAEAFGWLEEAGARNNRSDQAMIQSMHDYATKLGATCDATMTEAEPLSSPVPIAQSAVETTGTREAVTFVESATEIEFVPLSEASPVFDEANREIVIRPVRAGWGNKRDGRYYTREALREAIDDGVFTRRKMFADHPTKEEAKLRPERSVKDWVSTIREAWWDEKADEPRARIKVYDQKFWDLAKEAPDEIAFSIRGGGFGRKGKVDGKDAFIVESIGKINSVDWVTEAGAGGAIAFAESATEEFEMDIKDLTPEQLKDANPTLYEAIQKLSLRETDEPEAPVEAPAAPEAPVEAPAAPEAPAEVVVEESASLLARIVSLEKDKQDRESGDKHVVALTEAAAVVDAKLKASILPTMAKEAIKIRFNEAAVEDGGYITTEVLGKAVDAELAHAAKLLGSISRSSAPTSVRAPEDGGEKTFAQLIESRISDKWGSEALPSKTDYVFSNDREDKEVPAKAQVQVQVVESSAGQTVQDRLAERFQLN